MKKRITVFLKSGNHFTIVCTDFTITHRNFNCVGFKYEGAVENIPVFIDPEQIEAVIQETV